MSRAWGHVVISAALDITGYWPMVCLATVVSAHGLEGWNLANDNIYWVVLPAISLWGIFGLSQLTIEMKRRIA